MKKMISGIIVVIALSILYIGFVNASENQSYAVIQPITTPIENVSHELDSGVEIQNMTEYLFYWNERMDWKLSQKQISDLSIKAENQILKNLTSTDGKWYHIKNLTRFDEDLGTIIGLNGAQISAFITEQRNQLTIDHMNNDKPYQIQSPEKNGITSSISSISPGSQSAPFARGKLFYLYIITDFTILSSDGVWTQAEMNDAINDARSGTEQIRVQAPSSANVVIVEYQAYVTVTGQNFGDVASTWGPNGWMENVSKQFAFGQSGPYSRSTENLAYNLKQTYSADSVILCFFTHDNKGSTATGPDQGYADKVLVSYWGIGDGGIRFNSEPGSYEHETVHAYGALDEWGGNGIECNFWPSELAVSPMHEMYRNTNFYTCPGSTHSGVMYYPYDAFLYPWWEISQASRRWIGWGDYDNDGILDPLDNSPWGIDTIGVYRNGVFYLRNSNTAGPSDIIFNYGIPGDTPVIGDWNGDGIDTIGVYRNGVFYLRNSNTAGPADIFFNYGILGDKPVVGDWNGDGTDTIGVFRNGWFYLRNSNSAGNADLAFTFGIPGDTPLVGDWNGT